jgi:hypothetical protein
MEIGNDQGFSRNHFYDFTNRRVRDPAQTQWRKCEWDVWDVASAVKEENEWKNKRTETRKEKGNKSYSCGGPRQMNGFKVR